MANRLMQNIIEQMSPAYPCTIGIVDDAGFILACSDYQLIDSRININLPSEKTDAIVSNNNFSLRLIHSSQIPVFYAFVKGCGKEAETFVNILAVSIVNIREYAEDKFSSSNFIKNVIMDNILPGDVYIKSRELHFDTDTARVCFLVRITDKTNVSVFDILYSMFPDRQKDFIFSISSEDIAIVKEIPINTKVEALTKIGNNIVNTLANDYMTKVQVGIGTIVTSIKELARSFKEAQISLEIGKVFDEEENVIRYDNLGIARLIYQLPTTLCEMYMKEVFKNGSMESLDNETIFTIQKFFENNLNVSETSRKLFVHRNTLVYRLEKIKKITGLDLRDFDNAIVFKVAMMVKKYLNANPVKY